MDDCDDGVLLDGVLLELVELELGLLDRLWLVWLVELELLLVCGLEELELFVLDDDDELLPLEDSEELLLECSVELELELLELCELCPLLELEFVDEESDDADRELDESVLLELASAELEELELELDFDDEELNSVLLLDELLLELVLELELFANCELADDSLDDELVFGLLDEDEDFELLSDELEELL